MTHDEAVEANFPTKAAVVRELIKALEVSSRALDDWLNIYAEDECNADRVAQAKARVWEDGTLAYIAAIKEKNREALAKAKAAGL